MSDNPSSSSGDSDSSSEVFSQESLGDFDEIAIQPYQFEPEIELASNSEDSEDSNSESNDDQDQDRLQSCSWCTCGNCQIMDRINECICCQEVKKVVDKCQRVVLDGDATEPPTCITQHPGFLPVCVNKYVLHTAWMQYKQQYKDSYEGPEHKQYRHIAYRQLARWCWGFLGKEVRVVLPSCAVMCIRQHFPPPGLEEDFVFEGFHYADE